MLTKNCNAFDFTHKQIFKTLTCDNLSGRAFKVGGPVHLHTLHISKATTELADFFHTLPYQQDGRVLK